VFSLTPALLTYRIETGLDFRIKVYFSCRDSIPISSSPLHSHYIDTATPGTWKEPRKFCS